MPITGSTYSQSRHSVSRPGDCSTELLVASCGDHVRVHRLSSSASNLEEHREFSCNSDLQKSKGKVNCLAFNYNGQALFCCNGSCISLYLKGKEELLTLPLPADQSGDILCLAVTRDARYMVTGGDDGVLRLWDMKKKAVIRNLYTHPQGAKITCVKISNDNSLVSSGSTSGHVVVFSLRSMIKVAVFRGPDLVTPINEKENSVTGVRPALSDAKPYPVKALEFSRFKKHHLAVCTDGGSIFVYDTVNLGVKCTFLNLHQAPAMDISFSPLYAGLLVTVGLDKAIVFVDVEKQSVVTKMKSAYPLSAVSCAPSGDAIVVGTTNGKLLLYSLSKHVKARSQDPIQVLDCHDSKPINCVQFHIPSQNQSANSNPRIDSSSQSLRKVTKHGVHKKQVLTNSETKTSNHSYIGNSISKVTASSSPSSNAAALASSSSVQSLLFSPPMSVKKAMQKTASVSASGKDKEETKDNRHIPPVPEFHPTTAYITASQAQANKNENDVKKMLPPEPTDEKKSVISVAESISTIAKEHSPINSSFNVLRRPEKKPRSHDNGNDTITEASTAILESKVPRADPQNEVTLESIRNGHMITIDEISTMQHTLMKQVENKIEKVSKDMLLELREERRAENKELEMLLLRQFRLQMADISSAINEMSSKFTELELDNKRLRMENERLSKMF